VAEEINRRLAAIFLRGKDGRRPVYGGIRKFQEDPLWNDYIQFHEYFHGDNGAGLGASHQTGWTGIIARSIHLFESITAERFLKLGRSAAFGGKESPTASDATESDEQDQGRGRTRSRQMAAVGEDHL
jgi:hypothetical protein